MGHRPLHLRALGRARAILDKPLRRLTRPRALFMASRALGPISPLVGLDRGTPIDRHFIEAFLGRHAADVRGRVVEIKDREYTTRFGGTRVTRSDILDVNPDNSHATIHDDIRSLAAIPDASVDCFIITQVLQYVDDLPAAARAIRRVLAPGGVALVTVPTLGKLDGHEDNVAGHYWRLTTDSARYVFAAAFSARELSIEGWGNCRVGMSFLAGLAAEDLSRRELNEYDARYCCGVLIRARREE